MKKRLCLILIAALLLGGMGAFAEPELSSKLVKAAKSAVDYLASGEYERLVTLLPFSGVAPGAAEWERFARNYESLKRASDTAVYWRGDGWNIAVRVKGGDTSEAIVLLSEDGKTFTGYRYATWSQVKKECATADRVLED